MKPEELVYHWYEMSRIEYGSLYLKLYVAYNAWYRQATDAMNDREAMRRLKLRFVIWKQYLEGTALSALRSYHKEVVALTAWSKFSRSAGRSGWVKDSSDWQGLISFWYRVRCELIHGSLSPNDDSVRLAYFSLSEFMGEIVRRMARSFSDADAARLQELQVLAQSLGEGYEEEREILQAKYIASSPLWDVDMY